MQYDIVPYVGAGSIQLGMTSSQIQVICKEEPERFQKAIVDEYYTDSYKDFFVYFKEPGICDAIEFHKPANVFFNGIKLFDEPYQKVKEALLLIDSDVIIDNDGLTSLKFGFGIYAPYADESNPSYVAEGVIVFEKGYYD
jgi:hypothetical protein